MSGSWIVSGFWHTDGELYDHKVNPLQCRPYWQERCHKHSAISLWYHDNANDNRHPLVSYGAGPILSMPLSTISKEPIKSVIDTRLRFMPRLRDLIQDDVVSCTEQDSARDIQARPRIACNASLRGCNYRRSNIQSECIVRYLKSGLFLQLIITSVQAELQVMILLRLGVGTETRILPLVARGMVRIIDCYREVYQRPGNVKATDETRRLVAEHPMSAAPKDVVSYPSFESYYTCSL